jgi:hypothetical protein
VDDIRAAKKYYRVSVGMRVSHVNGLNRIAVEIEADRIGESDDRKRGSRRGGDPVVERSQELLLAHPAPDVLMGEDESAGSSHRFIAAGVIVVPVGVHHEPDRLRRDGRDRRLDLRRHRRVLVVDDEGIGFAHRQANVPARAFEHVDAPRYRYHPDRRLR